MNKNIKLKVKKTLKSLWREVKENKFMLVYMTSVVIMQDSTCFATSVDLDTNLPWSEGLGNFKDQITGPLAKVVSCIAIAGGAGSYIMGSSQITQQASRIGIGTGVVTGAPSLVKYFSDQTSGCLF